MNHSNRYGIESMARQRQAEIERQLRESAELRSLKSGQPSPRQKAQWAAIGATAISVLETLAFVVISRARQCYDDVRCLQRQASERQRAEASSFGPRQSKSALGSWTDACGCRIAKTISR